MSYLYAFCTIKFACKKIAKEKKDYGIMSHFDSLLSKISEVRNMLGGGGMPSTPTYALLRR